MDQPRSRSELCGPSVRVREGPPSPGHEEFGRHERFEGAPEESLRPEVGRCRRVSLAPLRVGRKWSNPSGTGIVPSTVLGRGRSGRNRFENPFQLQEGERGR